MIRLTKHPNHRQHPNQLISIKDVPESALKIVKKYESLFDENPVFDGKTWKEFSDLSLADAGRLKQELNDAGFECEIVESEYKTSKEN